MFILSKNKLGWGRRCASQERPTYHTQILGQQQITAYRQDLCKKIILQDTFDFVRSDGIFSIPGGLLVHPECLRVAVSNLLIMGLVVANGIYVLARSTS